MNPIEIYNLPCHIEHHVPKSHTSRDGIHKFNKHAKQLATRTKTLQKQQRNTQIQQPCNTHATHSPKRTTHRTMLTKHTSAWPHLDVCTSREPKIRVVTRNTRGR